MEGGHEFGSGRIVGGFCCFGVIPSQDYLILDPRLWEKSERWGEKNRKPKSPRTLGNLSCCEVRKGCTAEFYWSLHSGFSLFLKDYELTELLNFRASESSVFPYFKFLFLKTYKCWYFIYFKNEMYVKYMSTFLGKYHVCRERALLPPPGNTLNMICE